MALNKIILFLNSWFVKRQNCAYSLCQIKWSLSKQELLFSDFCEDSDNIEDGAEYNKVF